MITYLYGADAYRRGARLRRLISDFQEKFPQGGVGFFDCTEDGALPALERFVSALGLFSPEALAVVRSPEAGERALNKILKEVIGDGRVHLVLLADKKLPAAEFSVLKNDAQKGLTVESFDDFKDGDFLAYITEECQERNLKVSKEVIREVAAMYPGDTWMAMTELSSVAFGGSPTPPALTGGDFTAQILALIGQDVGRRLRSLYFFLRDDEPAKTFNIAAAWMRGATKVRMADYDVAIKTGKLEYEDALFDIVVRG